MTYWNKYLEEIDQIRKKTAEITKDMTAEEHCRYINEKAEAFQREIEEARGALRNEPSPELVSSES